MVVNLHIQARAKIEDSLERSQALQKGAKLLRSRQAGPREKEGKQEGLGEKGGKPVGQRSLAGIFLQWATSYIIITIAHSFLLALFLEGQYSVLLLLELGSLPSGGHV